MMTFCDEKSGDKTITFQQCLDKSLQIAHYFQSEGFKKVKLCTLYFLMKALLCILLCQGDIVCVFMENRLDYCCYWMGLSMIGVIPSLINNNLKHQSLTHTITVISSKAVIFSAETEAAVSEIVPDLADLPLYSADQTELEGAVSLPRLLPSQSTEVMECKRSGYGDTMVYIYTSGTTGLPKAATVKHSRFLFAVYALYHGLVITEEDVLYSPLPMYHTAAGLMVTGCAFTEGTSTVARKKFSASQFWRDCVTHKVTVSLPTSQSVSQLPPRLLSISGSWLATSTPPRCLSTRRSTASG